MNRSTSYKVVIAYADAGTNERFPPEVVFAGSKREAMKVLKAERRAGRPARLVYGRV